MTIEETIKHLKFIKDGYQNLIDNDVRAGEAIGKDIKAEWESEKTMAEVYMKMIISLEIAIKMLESQPCEDCISRADVLALAEKGTLVSNGNYKSVCKAIKALPSVMPKALEQTDGDCISREAVKEMLTEEWTKYMPMQLDINLSFVLEKIKELPSVTPKTEWIPASERLPEENEYIGDVCKYYLIQDEYGDMHVAHLSNVGWIPINSLKAIGDEVIAWTPLPEPYNAESEE